MSEDSGPLLSHPGDREIVPWKNGLGTATEVASSPAGATADDFDCRTPSTGPYTLVVRDEGRSAGSYSLTAS